MPKRGNGPPSTGHPQVDRNIAQQLEHGHDLLIVSASPEPSPECELWEDQILSATGTDRRYPSLQQAIEHGLFRPGCNHNVYAYIPGYTTPAKKERPAMSTPKSESMHVNAPTSYAGSAARIWRPARNVNGWLQIITIPAALIAICLAWIFVTCWYVMMALAFFITIPYRMIRRGGRKKKIEQQRHSEMLEAIQQKNGQG